MKVAIVASEVPSCEYYRARFAAEHLAREGEIELVPLDPRISLRAQQISPTQNRILGIRNPPDVDVLVFTRGVLPGRIADLIPLWQKEGIAVVVDYDDAYDRLSPELANLYKIHPKLSPLYNWDHAKRAAKLADLVTVSTPALKRYNREAIVIRNCIPEYYFDIDYSERDGKTVGWGGTIYGHPGDLLMPRAGVAQAIRQEGGRFLAVGDGVQVPEELDLDDMPEVTGIVPFADYPNHLARLDVGIAPLVLNSYTEAKSALKYLESLTFGSAVVASPTSEYCRLQDELDAFAAQNASPVPGAIARSKARDWCREVGKALRRSEKEREEVSECARAFVRSHYLVENNAYRWAEAWERAMLSRKTPAGRT